MVNVHIRNVRTHLRCMFIDFREETIFPNACELTSRKGVAKLYQNINRTYEDEAIDVYYFCHSYLQ